MNNPTALWIATALAAVALAPQARSDTRAALAVVPTPLVDVALAAEARGVIRSVEDGGFTLTMTEGELAVRVSERTQYTLDGEAAERSAVLRTGARVVVTHEAGMASNVAATSEHFLEVQTLRGSIRAVGEDQFTLATGDQETVVRIDAETEYTLDGEPSDKGAVLRAGEHVVVEVENGVADKVAARKSQALAVAEQLRGQVRAVEDDAFVVAHGEETTRVRTTNDTEYRLDGETATRSAVLAAGRSVLVEHADGVASRVEANSSMPLAPEAVRGTVGDITDAGFTLTTQGEPLTVRVDDKTKYLLDGEPAERSTVVKAGRVVSVEHTDGLATSVSAMTSR